MTGGGAGDLRERPSALRSSLIAAATALLFSLFLVGVVAAQADLISADPVPGTTVAGSPSIIRLSFSQPLEDASRMDLFTGQFQVVPGVTTQLAGSELRGVLGQPLAPATYTVQWTAVTDNGVSTRGSYQFAVAAQTSSLFGGRLTAAVAAAATIVTGGVAIFILVLSRRQRL